MDSFVSKIRKGIEMDWVIIMFISMVKMANEDNMEIIFFMYCYF